jgi:hypothetical protein
MKLDRHFACALLLLLGIGMPGGGCAAPRERLDFPTQPIERTVDAEWYDTSADGRRDFGITYSAGRADALHYDDDSDGQPDRVYRLADYANEEVPHVIVLLDSVPYQTLKDRYDAGDFRWFDPPQEMIAPFPSLTEVCYSDVLRAPPLPGAIDQYYDQHKRRRSDALWKRVQGYRQPWERRCHYAAGYMEHGLSFLDPKPWYRAELERVHRTIDASPDRVTIVYLCSAASMACKYGRDGVEEVLDGARQLCLQLLYERRGAIKISMMADHGHNYAPTANVRLDKLLEAGGFRPRDSIRADRDVVVEMNGLVTYAGVHTQRPAEVARLLVADHRIELVMYMEQERAVVRSPAGSAVIECRNGRLRYRPVEADVLSLGPLVDALSAEGLADADEFIDDAIWFERTLDHEWPNAPRRVWDALHRQVVNPPSVLISVRDGFCIGLPEYEKYIKMQSTHGGLNQKNSATFVMTMTGRVSRPLRHQDVLQTLEPNFEPRLRR